MQAEILAWLVPAALLGFGAVFLSLRLYGAGSWWWSIAYALAGLGYALSIVPVGPFGVVKPLVEDALLLTGLAALSRGITTRFRVEGGETPLLVLIGGGLFGAAVALCGFASVPAEISCVQAACALILLHTARVVAGRRRTLIDQILFMLCLMVAVALLAQNLVYIAVPDRDLTIETWRLSPWAFVFQITGTATGLAFAFAILIAIGTDMLHDLHRISATDPLTGTLNRRGFEARCLKLLAPGAAGDPGSVIVVDIDHFKRVNDTYGHDAGDAIICAMAALLQHVGGARACVGRLGGEEFAVLLPRVTLTEARQVAEQARRAFAATEWPGDLAGARTTVSLGVTEIGPGETVSAAIARADRLLYSAKHGGRNRTVWCQYQPDRDPTLAMSLRPLLELRGAASAA